MLVVYLFYQVSDKRLHLRCGKEESFLTEAGINSADLRIPHQRCRSPEMKIRFQIRYTRESRQLFFQRLSLRTE